ncbi:hypothetical protein TH53_05855 [Pedobacter lusitanus]|uniref:Uncharacterized protein n=1 Tax=Pedobacter lusitanus TaxID=1503925 RepID=A0A0D0FZX3_9SPHI|nr:hypothetical protein TH53_05855 [Pedobacter lusitanus]
MRKKMYEAIGPIWEANHMWLIIVIVILFVGLLFGLIAGLLFGLLVDLLFGQLFDEAWWANHWLVYRIA